MPFAKNYTNFKNNEFDEYDEIFRVCLYTYYK